MPPGRFRRGRRRGLIVGAAVGSAAARRNSSDNQQSYQQPQVQDGQYAELEQLGELRDRGILTEDEFNEKKKQILGI